MSADAGPTRDLTEPALPVQVKLAAAWTSLVFLYVYVDILGLYLPGVVEDILAGVVWEFDISQTWASGALALMAVPILMITCCLILPARANRTTNLLVAPAYVLVSVGNAVGESWVSLFTLAVGLEVLVLSLIVRSAWAWRESTPGGSAAHGPARSSGAP